METPKHKAQMDCLIESLSLAWKDRTDYYVGGNMFFYFSETQSRRNDFRGPDVFVTLDTDQRPRLSWVVWEEDGKRPDVIIELTSPSTTDIDHGPKLHLYARLGVSEYFIFDPEAGVLEGHRLDPSTGRYLALKVDARGWLPSMRLGLWLGILPEKQRFFERGPWLRWFDADGRMLVEGWELAEAESARAEAESARAEAESARGAALAAKLAEYERRFGKLGDE